MTLGFLVSFGGLVLVFVVGLAIEQVLIRRGQRAGQARRASVVDAAASLDRAQLAMRAAEAELAQAREQLRAS